MAAQTVNLQYISGSFFGTIFNQPDKTMKNLKAYFAALLVMLTLTLSSCEVIGDIFKAGMWTAVILIVIVVLLIMWLFRAIRGRGPRP